MRKTGGFQGLMETIFGLGGTLNAFDQFGHFTRALIPPNICFDYTLDPAVGLQRAFRLEHQHLGTSRDSPRCVREPVDTGRAGDRGDADARFDTGGGAATSGSDSDEPAPEEPTPPAEEQAPERRPRGDASRRSRRAHAFDARPAGLLHGS